MENTNLLFALAPDNVDTGSLRESFFMNQLSNTEHNISLPLKGDFLVDDTYTFEVGGAGKANKQIEGINKAYLALDNLESGINNKIPLWLFGFLY
ncbi:hypothetical protein D3C85_1527760 [compost metagenome]